MGSYIGRSRGNLQRLGFIASLSPIMMLGLWAALVCRAPTPQPGSIGFGEGGDIGQTALKFPLTGQGSVCIAGTHNDACTQGSA